jgi:hypothetical protein
MRRPESEEKKEKVFRIFQRAKKDRISAQETREWRHNNAT